LPHSSVQKPRKSLLLTNRPGISRFSIINQHVASPVVVFTALPSLYGYKFLEWFMYLIFSAKNNNVVGHKTSVDCSQ